MPDVKTAQGIEAEIPWYWSGKPGLRREAPEMRPKKQISMCLFPGLGVVCGAF
jgi:hypothetical protein